MTPAWPGCPDTANVITGKPARQDACAIHASGPRRPWAARAQDRPAGTGGRRGPRGDNGPRSGGGWRPGTWRERWTSVDGQEPIMIFGRVTRSDGAPVSGAALTLCDLSGDQLDRAAADEDGHYQLVPPTGGTYLVICSSSTHRPQASLVAVADRPLRHDLGLTGGGATLAGMVGVRRAGGTNGADGGVLTGWGDVVLTLTDVRGTVV